MRADVNMVINSVNSNLLVRTKQLQYFIYNDQYNRTVLNSIITILRSINN